MPPSHTIQVWLAPEDTIHVSYPDGQHVVIPISEAGRLVTILRGQIPRPPKRFLTIARPAFTDDDIREKGAAIRAKHELDKKRSLKKHDKFISRKRAQEILDLIGM